MARGWPRPSLPRRNLRNDCAAGAARYGRPARGPDHDPARQGPRGEGMGRSRAIRDACSARSSPIGRSSKRDTMSSARTRCCPDPSTQMVRVSPRLWELAMGRKEAAGTPIHVFQSVRPRKFGFWDTRALGCEATSGRLSGRRGRPAMGDAKKRIGKAISSGEAKRRRGMTDRNCLYSRLFLITGALISVSTQPGAMQFTRMP